MIKKSVKTLAMICLVGSLAACSYVSKPTIIQHRDTDYLTASTAKPLMMPAGIKSDTFHSAYPVSEHAYEGQPKQVSLLPPGINS